MSNNVGQARAVAVRAAGYSKRRTDLAHGTPWGGLILLVFLEGRVNRLMVHVGLDLSRKRVDVCLISSEGELVEHFRAPCDRDGLYGLTRRVAVYDEPVRGVVESMNGARFVHDELVSYGWEVLVADAQRVKGLAPLACKTDKVDAGCWRSCRSGIWCRRSGCPRPSCGQSESAPGGGCTWSSTERRSRTGFIRR